MVQQTYWRVTPPAIEPVELVAAKNHLRLEIEDDDDLVCGLISAARLLVEEELARSLISTGWRTTLDAFPGHAYWPYLYSSGWPPPERWLAPHGCPIRLPVADAIAVTSLSYVDTAGVSHVLAPSAYTLAGKAPGYVVPYYGTSWPATRCHPGSVTVDFTAGYGPARSDVPAHVTQALLLLIGHLYENREATASGGLREAPFGVQAMTALASWGAYG